MAEISLSRGRITFVDDEDADYLKQFNWTTQGGGYVVRRVYINGVRKEIYLHREVMNARSGNVVDHINGDVLDNRKSNLRECSQAMNVVNTRITSNNSSGYKGVSWDSRAKKWRSQIFENRKCIFLGNFESKHDAARMYNFWAKDIYGEFAVLNTIELVGA